MSWFNLSSKRITPNNEKEEVQYKDLDDDETEHIIDNEDLEVFYDDRIDVNEQEEED